MGIRLHWRHASFWGAAPSGAVMGRKGSAKRNRGGCNNQRGMLSSAAAVGRITQDMMGSRKAGRAEYAPLRRYKGGEARTADLNRKKRKHGRLRFFLLCGPRLRPGAVPPPLSR
jgi:hypothetical protein